MDIEKLGRRFVERNLLINDKQKKYGEKLFSAEQATSRMWPLTGY